MLDVFSVGRTCTEKGGVRFFPESTTVASLDISGSRAWVRWRSGGPGGESVSSGLYVPEGERAFQLPLPSRARALGSWGRCGAWGVALPRYCTSPQPHHGCLQPARARASAGSHRPGCDGPRLRTVWPKQTPVAVHTTAALPWPLRQVRRSRATGSKNELKWYGLGSFSSSPGSASRWQSGRTRVWREPRRGRPGVLQLSRLQPCPSWQTRMDSPELAGQHLQMSFPQLDISLACRVSDGLFPCQISYRLTQLTMAWRRGLEQPVLPWVVLRNKPWGATLPMFTLVKTQSKAHWTQIRIFCWLCWLHWAFTETWSVRLRNGISPTLPDNFMLCLCSLLMECRYRQILVGVSWLGSHLVKQ